MRSRHPHRRCGAAIAIAALGGLAGAPPGEAQIRTDGTLGGPAVTLAGPNFLIGEALGRLAGANLFHSFQAFSIAAGESATFVTSTPGLANVVSRVTGGAPSQINGALRLAASNAAPSFFFINPAGVIFGAGAAIDLPAAFHVTTADYVKFPDGNFYADTARASTLSAAAPEAFGFLGTARAAISVRDGAVLQSSSSAADRPIALVGGDLQLDFGAVETGGSALRAIAAGDGAREIPLAGPVATARGDIDIRNGGYLASLSGGDGPAGDITVAAGNLSIDGAYGAFGFTGITSQAFGESTARAGSIAIGVHGDVVVRRNGVISSESSARGGSGSIRLAGDTLAVSDGSAIGTSTGLGGKAGDVFVTAGDIAIDGANRGDVRTGIISVNELGEAGNVEVIAARLLTIVDGGEIAADTVGAGRGGDVVVRAAELSIDSRGSTRFTGISSDTVFGSGLGGDVDVAVSGALTLTGGVIASRTGASGDAGSVRVDAGTLTVTQFGAIDASTFASGRAGTVEVVADAVTLETGGAIRSNTNASGHAGSVSVAAGELAIDGAGAPFNTGVMSRAELGGTGDAGNVTVHVAGRLLLANRGTINSDTFTNGRAGTVAVTADVVQMYTGSDISSDTFGAGNAGSIDVSARTIEITGGGGDLVTEISSLGTAFATGHAGDIRVTATETLTIADGGTITSNTYGPGNAGTVEVTADRVVVRTGGRIGSDTFFGGHAGTVTVGARELFVGDSDFLLSRISSDSFSATGNAGDVRIDVGETLTLARGGIVSSGAASAGHAGTVVVTARNVLIDGGGASLTGINSDSGVGATGNAGDVRVDATESLTIVNRGRISSDTFNTGPAGTVTVAADAIVIASGGLIASETYGAGDAGSVAVAARTLDIRGEGNRFTGVATGANSFSAGNAGNVAIAVAETLSLASQGTISSGTSGGGRAGAVRVDAARIALDTGAAIGAAAIFGSSGQTGTVAVQASEGISLVNGAVISVTNEATVANPAALAPTLLTVEAPTISLASGGQITAASSGNVAASNVEVSFGANLTMRDAAIATSARDGNGGAIAVHGSGVLTLQDSQITTSVAGRQGNGGDIALAAPLVVMQTGFVQANTAAAAASGGDVSVEVTSLLPSGSTLFVGGETPYSFAPGVFGFNVIQAAAPTGVSGQIVISTPALDIAGSITTLPARFLDAGGPARSPCAIVGGSSLSQVGRGGMPSSATGVLRRDLVEATGAPLAANLVPLAAATADSDGPLRLIRPIVEPCGDRG